MLVSAPYSVSGTKSYFSCSKTPGFLPQGAGDNNRNLNNNRFCPPQKKIPRRKPDPKVRVNITVLNFANLSKLLRMGENA